MAAFVALKPCRFGGVDYAKGSIIPDGVVLPSRVLTLTRQGTIAPAMETPATPPAEKEKEKEGKSKKQVS